ncbi:hypothetical protein B296_00057488, partial [Ensete ventricosum]
GNYGFKIKFFTSYAGSQFYLSKCQKFRYPGCLWNEKLCTLCEEYASQAINYLSENETQTQIISRLHESCSQLHSFKRQLEVIEILLKGCNKMGNYAKKVSFPIFICLVVCGSFYRFQPNSVNYLLIINMAKMTLAFLFFFSQCKKMVLEYGPLILINAENFLQKNDVCAAIRACQDSEEDLTGSVLADA